VKKQESIQHPTLETRMFVKNYVRLNF